MCRTYGAGRRGMPCTQPFRAGLWCSAPPALRSESPITNSKLPTPNHELQAGGFPSPVTSYDSQIPSRPFQCADPQSAVPGRRFPIDRDDASIPDRPRQGHSAGGATDGSPARKGWVRWPEKVRAPEVRHISDLAPLPALGNRFRNSSFGHSSERSRCSAESLRIRNKSRREALRPPRGLTTTVFRTVQQPVWPLKPTLVAATARCAQRLWSTDELCNQKGGARGQAPGDYGLEAALRRVNPREPALHPTENGERQQ